MISSDPFVTRRYSMQSLPLGRQKAQGTNINSKERESPFNSDMDTMTLTVHIHTDVRSRRCRFYSIAPQKMCFFVDQFERRKKNMHAEFLVNPDF